MFSFIIWPFNQTFGHSILNGYIIILPVWKIDNPTNTIQHVGSMEYNITAPNSPHVLDYTT